jgi:signal transduction histidine kinase
MATHDHVVSAVTPSEPPPPPAAPPEASDRDELDPAIAAELARLRHEIALRDEFIATTAHELRNPLSPVYMQLEYLKETLNASPASHEPVSRAWLTGQLDAMTLRLDRFLGTLNRLLDASRLGAGHLVLLPERCDLVEITRGVLAASERHLLAAACRPTLIGPQAVVGHWDRMRLEQIVSNLVSNAARYGAGEPISIAITERPTADGGWVQLTVRDHGIGIAPSDQARIFQRFERARNVGRSAGLGIGLWVVAELCRAMGGRVEVDSELGCGATFTVTLPRELP